MGNVGGTTIRVSRKTDVDGKCGGDQGFPKESDHWGKKTRKRKAKAGFRNSDSDMFFGVFWIFFYRFTGVFAFPEFLLFTSGIFFS